MVLAPFNTTLFQAIRAVQDDRSATEQFLAVLKGLLTTLLPALRYIPFFNQATEYVQRRRVDHFSWTDLLHGGLSFTLHHFMGHSFEIQRVLDQAITNVNQATPTLPLLQNPITQEAHDWMTEGNTVMARLAHLGANIVMEGTFEMMIRSRMPSQLFPVTYRECFILIQAFFKNDLSEPQKYIVSYLLGFSLEKIFTDTAKLSRELKKMIEGVALRYLITSLVEKFFKKDLAALGFPESFFDQSTSRSLELKILDFVITLGIVYIKDMIDDIMKRVLPLSAKVLLRWISYYYHKVFDYFEELYVDIYTKAFLNQERLEYHIEAVIYLARISINIFSAAKEDIQTIIKTGTIDDEL